MAENIRLRRPPVCSAKEHSAIIDDRAARAIISQHPRRAMRLQIDAGRYKWRLPIGNFFCRLSEFKRIAWRADRTDQSLRAMIPLAAAVINAR